MQATARQSLEETLLEHTDEIDNLKGELSLSLGGSADAASFRAAAAKNPVPSQASDGTSSPRHTRPFTTAGVISLYCRRFSFPFPQTRLLLCVKWLQTPVARMIALKAPSFEKHSGLLLSERRKPNSSSCLAQWKGALSFSTRCFFRGLEVISVQKICLRQSFGGIRRDVAMPFPAHTPHCVVPPCAVRTDNLCKKPLQRRRPSSTSCSPTCAPVNAAVKDSKSCSLFLTSR